MTVHSAGNARPPVPAPRAGWRGAAGAALAAAVVSAAAAQGWPWAAAAVASAALAGALIRPRQQPAPSAPLVHTQASGLARQVVPVWERHVSSARLHAEQSMSALTESFGAIMGQMDQALQGTTAGSVIDGETVDMLVERHQPEINELLATTREIAAVKNDMQAGVQNLMESLVETARLSKEVQAIGRATHLLALNASVEAARAGTSGGASAAGFAAVAHEVRMLAGQSRDAGQALARHLARMQERVHAMKRQGDRLDNDDDELSLQAEQRARALVRALLGSLAEVSRSQQNLHQAGHLVQAELERILMSLQAQDRFSQMLGSVTEDMSRMHAWLEGADDEAAVSANKWLERLDSTYTMEEMRSSHHGTTQVEKAAEVEFF